jgi:hypothetical protein
MELKEREDEERDIPGRMVFAEDGTLFGTVTRVRPNDGELVMELDEKSVAEYLQRVWAERMKPLMEMLERNGLLSVSRVDIPEYLRDPKDD